MENDTRAPRSVYAGFVLVTLATLVYQLLLTRVFSVTIWYHFAFFVISLALFGMTLGAVIVYVYQRRLVGEKTGAWLSRFSFWFSVTTVASFLFHLVIPFGDAASLTGSLSIALTYVVMCIPFTFSGAVVALVLTRYAFDAERLYAADLAGAGAGCILVIALLTVLDAPSAVFVTAALPAIAAYAFTKNDSAGTARSGRTLLLLALSLILVAVGHAALTRDGQGFLRPLWVKGVYEGKALYEKWNPISRVRVEEVASFADKPFGWGLSPNTPTMSVPKQLYLTIDANAGTVLTNYNGASSSIEYLRWDITNAVHMLRRNASVFVIGVGGGRDILSAFAFGARKITGLEVNGAIIDTVKRVYGDFTGHIERDPRVSIVNDEARSYLSRTDEHFDIIQISLIDTWAATAAGAFTLTENTLYTTNAWHIFFDRLSEDGILSVSRWYVPARPAEAYRLLALAAASLSQEGVTHPREHMIMLRVMRDQETAYSLEQGIVTLLLSKSAFREDDIARIGDYARLTGFEVVLSPNTSAYSAYEYLADGNDPSGLVGAESFHITPPTDNDPFFFQTAKLGTLFSAIFRAEKGLDRNAEVVLLLGVLFLVVTVLVLLTIVLPLRLYEGRFPSGKEFPLLLYFMGIGFGFILIEIAEMQRFIVFLGHPTYALSVVLFTLLMFAGLGSWSTGRIGNAENFRATIVRRFILLLCTFVALHVAHLFLGALARETLLLRIGIAVIMLAPSGYLMGSFFPAGMRLARERAGAMIPWFWGINGALSVFASVAAPLIAITCGFSFVFSVGAIAYVATFATFLYITSRNARRAE